MTTSTPTTPNVSFVGDTGPALRTGDAAFDAQLARSLTAAMRGSADLGEVAVTVSRITPGDLGSWRGEWRATADWVRADGDESLAAGHRVTRWQPTQLLAGRMRAALEEALLLIRVRGRFPWVNVAQLRGLGWAGGDRRCLYTSRTELSCFGRPGSALGRFVARGGVGGQDGQ